jgi:glutathione S-transferase
MIAFYEEPFSHWCVKARRILDYKRVPYDTHRVGYHDKRELIRATGQDYVPALVDGAAIVTWPDVPDYLERIAPRPTIYPGDCRAEARLVESWAHWRLEEVVWRWVVPDMPKTFADPMERWVFEEIQTLKRGPLELMAVRRPEFAADLDAHLALVEDLLDGRRCLLGAEPSLADFAVFGALSPIPYAGHEIPGRFPRLAAWHARIAAV